MNAVTMVWTGRVLTGVFALFMLAGSIAPKFLFSAEVGEGMRALGWPSDSTVPLGMMELACLLLYLFPRTSSIGAVLMTAVLGGAIATQLRVGNPLLTHVLFGVYLGVFMWVGLALRDARLRQLIRR